MLNLFLQLIKVKISIMDRFKFAKLEFLFSNVYLLFEWKVAVKSSVKRIETETVVNNLTLIFEVCPNKKYKY